MGGERQRRFAAVARDACDGCRRQKFEIIFAIAYGQTVRVRSPAGAKGEDAAPLAHSFWPSDRLNPPYMRSGVTELSARCETFSSTDKSSVFTHVQYQEGEDGQCPHGDLQIDSLRTDCVESEMPRVGRGVLPDDKIVVVVFDVEGRLHPDTMKASSTDEAVSGSKTRRWNVTPSVKSRPSDPSKRTHGKSTPLSAMVAKALAGRRAVAARTGIPTSPTARRAPRVSGCARP